jgi:hypothetical protein
MNNTFVMVDGEFGDAWDKGFSDGYDGKNYNNPFPVGSNQFDEYDEGHMEGRADFLKLNPDL